MKPMFVCLMCLVLAGPVSLGGAKEVKRVNIGPAATVERKPMQSSPMPAELAPKVKSASAQSVAPSGNNFVNSTLERGLGLGFGFNSVF